jgi:1,2-phenylacetyl-CoA epoxidase PaaB subunit
MALENARDVFVRRPNCLSVWVVPASAVYARTAEELRDAPEPTSPAGGGRDARAPDAGGTASGEPYLVFIKQGQTARETFVAHVGQVEAASPPRALAQARATFPDRNVFVWWVVPARAVIRSAPGDAPSLFEPAHAKRYRSHLAYPVEPVMRELKSAQEMLDG